MQLQFPGTEIFSEAELRMILGHELGHVLSDHALYKTMLSVFSRLAMGAFAVPLGALVFSYWCWKALPASEGGTHG